MFFSEIVVERNIRLLRNTKDDILNNSLTVFVHIMKFSGIQHNTGLHYMNKKHEEFFRIYTLCDPQKKENHTDYTDAYDFTLNGTDWGWSI